jgi:hypothetical protein
VNCHDVDRWLDEGSPEAERAAMMLHVRICARCAAAAAAEEELEMALAAAPAAPTGFTDRVMARVAGVSQVRIPVLEVLPLLRAFPWWVRLALEPAALLAAVLAAALVWQGNTLFRLATAGALQLGIWLAQVPPLPTVATVSVGDPVVALLLQPTVLTCMVIGALPLAWMMAQVLFGWSATLVSPRHLSLRLR